MSQIFGVSRVMARSGVFVPVAKTRISIPPSLAIEFRARRSMSSGTDASAFWIPSADPALCNSFCNARSRSSRRAAAITRAPCFANITAVARPMPLEAPITRTFLSAKETLINLKSLARLPCRFPLHQLHAQHSMLRSAAFVGCALQQDVNGGFSQFIFRLVNGGEWWMSDRRQFHIIKAHQ